MKAIQFREFGGPDVLKNVDIDMPSPRGREVLIKVHASAVNYADTARREGQYVVKTPLPYIPGAEVSGIVTEVGEDVTRIKKGDRVVAMMDSGGYAEYAMTDERSIIPLPYGLDFKEAAAIPVQGLSAYHILKTLGRLEQGETVLIHAAAGGVGLLAVQLAKRFGAGKVIATASTEEKLRLAEDMGADVLVNYTEEEWEKKVLGATNGKGVHLALEMAGGDVFYKTLKCLAHFGRMIIYGVASGEQSRFYPSSLMAKNQSVTGFFLPPLMRDTELTQKTLHEIFHYVANGDLKVTVGHVFPLEEAAKVHSLMQGRQTVGKVILQP
ncbi:quinone oxidoreductase family protein [Rossellomorea vietnamensis]|uniref:quinone oxidoreductase family protein n=1 Tax=Rossellomorea vietnamensis TaxID=218284 RepID=UPI001E3F3990|nr:NADPH:quinone oxidoreductase family protein [Rossellomorea vietnamensis]MCC5800749.1 NADPH:quinone oxidoreductase family protein [Rossellomorea vietnamensis]